jgi:hypothetical protein
MFESVEQQDLFDFDDEDVLLRLERLFGEVDPDSAGVRRRGDSTPEHT